MSEPQIPAGPFNSNAVCPKCGGGDLITRWCSGQNRSTAWGEVWHQGEAIHRNCKRCGYEWVERPLDSSPAQGVPEVRKPEAIADGPVRLQEGTRVRTTAPNVMITDWGVGSRVYCQWRAYGTVVQSRNSHGICYEVRHQDGVTAWYDSTELEVMVT